MFISPTSPGIPLASQWHPMAGGDLCNPRVRRGVPSAEEVLRRAAGALRVPKGPRSTGSADPGEIGDLGDLKTRLPEIFHECNMILIWLVVWNMNFIFPYVGNNHPN